MAAFNAITKDEDIAMIEGLQRAMAGDRFRPGPLAQPWEAAIAHFHHHLLEGAGSSVPPGVDSPWLNVFPSLPFPVPMLRGSHRTLLTDCLARITEDRSFNAWITVLSETQLEAYVAALETRPRGPLWGVPFAVKDNIDVAGLPTAGCEAFAHTFRVGAGGAGPYRRRRHSPRENPSGSVCDGPRGHRAFSGPCLNSVDPAYLSGGSSSGSAVALGRGHVAFSLGTDTAGSGGARGL